MEDELSGRVTPTPDHDIKEEGDNTEKIITECVDVYLLAPEDDRAVELKDFTIMKPKNNKMHRLVRYYPRCEISYRAVPPPPPEEKVVTSPNGTNTTTIMTTHRHNGGFSNPSRNAEVFRLKRKLLKEYYAAIKKDPAFGALEDDQYTNYSSAIRSTYRRPASPSSWGPSESSGAAAGLSDEPPLLATLPKYRRFVLGDEDDIPVTSELQPRMSWKARINYISSLWPDLAPVDDDEDIMDYYGLEVQIISEEERKKELAEASGEANTATDVTADAKSTDFEVKGDKETVASPVKLEASNGEEEEEEDDESGPEMTVETRSAAKLKDSEPKMSAVATKQDDWVQCDKCSKWRRLPNHVNVSELPATWYCKMNRWDKRFNKCSAPEEKVVVPMKESDLIEFRERKFVQDFLQRVKRMEKAIQQYKFADAREDVGERQFVQCVECLKKRPLIGGMDARKIAQPFVCWMNSWDEMRSSCSAPQGPIPTRNYDLHPSTGSASATAADDGASGSAKKSASGEKSHHASASKSASGSGSVSAKKPSTSKSTTSGNSSKPQAKRRPSDPPGATDKTGSGGGSSHAAAAAAAGSSGSAKKPKRR